MAVGDVGISSITYCELQFGVSKSSRPEANQRALSEFLGPLKIGDFPAAAAPLYGELRAITERRGTPIGPLDLLIAAHALHLGLTLVTNNVREFERIPGLRLENWVS